MKKREDENRIDQNLELKGLWKLEIRKFIKI